MKKELIAPCGIYCGLCNAYLAYANNILKKKGLITHCVGCRPRNKRCAYLKITPYGRLLIFIRKFYFYYL